MSKERPQDRPDNDQQHDRQYGYDAEKEDDYQQEIEDSKDENGNE